MHPGGRIKLLPIFSSPRWVRLTCWPSHLRGVGGADEARTKAVLDPDRLCLEALQSCHVCFAPRP